MAPTGGECAETLAVGDLNGDGHPDLATTNYNSGNLAILLNQGDGTFAAAVTYALKFSAGEIALADYDGNGTLDLAVGLPSNYPASFETFFNDGVGALTVGDTYNYGVSQTTGWLPGAMIAADFEGTGRNGLLVTESGTNDFLLYSNPGNGVFGAPTSIALDGQVGPMFAADFNRDGVLDIATSVWVRPADGGSVTRYIALVLGAGNGSFSPAVNLGYSEAPNYVAAGDFNGDGYPDIAMGDMNWVNVLLSQCQGDAGDGGADASLAKP
jgi:hypothetical protein